jgi:photosystem II stability/assembly factor-like uncharacterized protein
MHRGINSSRWMSAILLSIIMTFIMAQLATAQTWTTLTGPNKPRNLKDITVSATGDKAYVIDQTGIYKTTNAGTSWAKTADQFSSSLVLTCRPDKPETVAVGISGYIYQSFDGGTTFPYSYHVQSMTPLNLTTDAMTPSNIYLGTQSLPGDSIFYRSVDNGLTWHAMPNFLHASNLNDIAPWPNNSSTEVWVALSDPTKANDSIAPSCPAGNRGVWKWNGTNYDNKLMGGFNVTALGIDDRSGYTTRIYAGSTGGKIYRTDDYGSNWTDKTGTVTGAIRKIRVRNNNGFVYAITSDGVFKSEDYGNSWSNLTSTVADHNISALSIVPSAESTFFATASKNLFKTTNSGANWLIADSGMGFMNTSAVAANGSTLWSVSKDYSVISRYDGSTWSNYRIGNQTTDPQFAGFDIVRCPNGNVLAAGSKSNVSTLYKSTDSGANFDTVTVNSADGSMSGNTFKGIAVDPANSTRVYLFGHGSHGNYQYNLYYNNYSGVSNQWFPVQVEGTGANTVNSLILDSGSVQQGISYTLYAGLSNGTIYKSVNGGTGWGSAIKTGLGCVNSLAINAGARNFIFAATTTGLYRSTDFGVNWGQLLTGSWSKVIMRPGSINDGLHIAIVTSYGDTVQYSNDGGVTWISGTGDVGKHVWNLTGVRGDTAIIYAATDVGIYYMKRPNTPVQYEATAPIYLNDTLSWTSPTNAQNYHLYIADNDQFESPRINADGLASTTYINWNLMVGTYYWKVAAANIVGESPYQTSPEEFTTQSKGDFTITLTSVAGQHPALSWPSQGSGLTYTIYRYACVYGSGDCGEEPYTPLATTTTTSYTDANVTALCKCSATSTYYYQVRASGISNKITVDSGPAGGGGGGEMEKGIADNIPKETKLYENYPNPFNPVTTIQYDLNQNGFAILKIYDVLGREVATLVNEVKNAGSYTVQFDASKLSSGVYFSRMEAGKYVGIKKLLLLK